MTYVTAEMNRGENGASYNNDNTNFWVRGKDNGIYHWNFHGNFSNSRHSITEEVGADNLPVWVGEANVLVLVQGVEDTDTDGLSVKESPQSGWKKSSRFKNFTDFPFWDAIQGG